MQNEVQQRCDNFIKMVDKTAALEQALRRVSCVYVEGAAASGKTTAVQMLMKKHPGVCAQIYDLDKKDQFALFLKNSQKKEVSPKKGEKKKSSWIIFENLPIQMPEEMAKAMAFYVREMPENTKVIFVSRDRPPQCFLDMVWKRQMEIVQQKELLFTLAEVRELTEKAGNLLPPDDLYRITGGWAGCVDVMLRLAQHNQKEALREEKPSVEELRDSYEINAYIREEIIHALTEQEQQLIQYSIGCPWFHERICREVWNLDAAQDIPERLERKGLLVRTGQKKRWKLAPLLNTQKYQNFFERQIIESEDAQKLLYYRELLAEWYEKNGYLREALFCFRQLKQKEKYRECLIRHYEKVPFLGMPYGEIMNWKESTPEVCYLRGMCYYRNGEFDNLAGEADAIGPEHPQLYLNLMFANPLVSLDEWLELVERLSDQKNRKENRPKFRLFHILGYSHTYLCGIRDLSGLFACSKKEENRKANIWKNAFGETEWEAYCLARADFYLETGRGNTLHKEDIKLLTDVQDYSLEDLRDDDTWEQNTELWQKSLACLYLLCRLQFTQRDAQRREQIFRLAGQLMQVENSVCRQNTEAILAVSSPWLEEPEQLTRWLREHTDSMERISVEKNGTASLFQVKGYLFLNQYERAGKILQKVIPYLKDYHMTYLYAEALFQQGLVNWSADRHGQALRNAIESFLVTGSNRYVRVYTIYGQTGCELLEEYTDWVQKNTPGGWHRKKKYNYGNVLQMPLEDYLDLILRRSKRNISKSGASGGHKTKENLTMMETIILQEISRGLTNAEICTEQNLKLSTVKSHIYSLYKKLGVSSRVQATLKGKEMGIVK